MLELVQTPELLRMLELVQTPELLRMLELVQTPELLRILEPEQMSAQVICLNRLLAVELLLVMLEPQTPERLRMLELVQAQELLRMLGLVQTPELLRMLELVQTPELVQMLELEQMPVRPRLLEPEQMLARPRMLGLEQLPERLQMPELEPRLSKQLAAAIQQVSLAPEPMSEPDPTVTQLPLRHLERLPDPLLLHLLTQVLVLETLPVHQLMLALQQPLVLDRRTLPLLPRVRLTTRLAIPTVQRFLQSTLALHPLPTMRPPEAMTPQAMLPLHSPSPLLLAVLLLQNQEVLYLQPQLAMLLLLQLSKQMLMRPKASPSRSILPLMSSLAQLL